MCHDFAMVGLGPLGHGKTAIFQPGSLGIFLGFRLGSAASTGIFRGSMAKFAQFLLRKLDCVGFWLVERRRKAQMLFY